MTPELTKLIAESSVTINELKAGSFYIMFYNPGNFTIPAIRSMGKAFIDGEIKMLMVSTSDVPEIFKVDKPEAA